MLDSFSEKLGGIFKKLSGQGRISEKNVQDALRELRFTLLEADVNFDVARKFIGEQFGAPYLPEKPNVYAAGQRAQEAHEAIRPSHIERTPDSLMGSLTEEQYKLYRLIWQRFVACQMTPAVWKVTEADIVADTSSGAAVFKAMGRQLAFDGFMRVTGLARGGDQVLPPLQQDLPVAQHEEQRRPLHGRPVGPVNLMETSITHGTR